MAQMSGIHREMSDSDFARISHFVQSSAGIKMPPHKKTMAEMRLSRRLRMLGVDSFGEYCDLVFKPDSQESVWMLDALTTNKTDFFREPEHFEQLRSMVLPQLLMNSRQLSSGERPFRVWSAGCSTGEEPYTVAISMAEAARDLPQLRWEVFASDISVGVLKAAKCGVYNAEKAVDVPDELLHRYFLRSKDAQSPLVRVVKELRDRLVFRHANLLDPDTYPDHVMDVIFCRNVLIYFERETQIAVLRSLFDMLAPGGFLFVGHSETLHGMGLPFEHVAPTVYRRP